MPGISVVLLCFLSVSASSSDCPNGECPVAPSLLQSGVRTCQSSCYDRNGAAKLDKCGQQRCAGCCECSGTCEATAETDDSPTTTNSVIGGECEKWCPKKVQDGTQTWGTLCNRQPCAGCDQCLPTTTLPPGMTTTSTTWLPPSCDSAHSNAIYVSPDGTDSASAKVFKTVDFAAIQAKPGDTIILLPGEYINPGFGESIWHKGSTAFLKNIHGTKESPITVTACKAGESTIRGDRQAVMEIKGSSYINIFNLTVKGEADRISWDEANKFKFAYKRPDSDKVYYRANPSLTDEEVAKLKLSKIRHPVQRPSRFNTHGLSVHTSHHIMVVGCHIHHAPGSGLKFWHSSHIKAVGNIVHDNTKFSSLGVHGLLVYHQESMNGDSSTGYSCVITGNIVHSNYNRIYSWSPSKTMIHPEIDEGKGLSVQKTNAEYNWKAGRILIANNVAYGNGFSGIHVNQGTRVDILFNTVVDNHVSGHGMNTGISTQVSDDVRIENNLISSVNDWGGYALATSNSANIQLKHNIVQGEFRKPTEDQLRETIFGDPSFADRDVHDYRPNSDLAQTCLYDPAVSFDAYGQVRPQAKHTTCGAILHQN